ncbi:MAG: ABC transporter permease, partial [Pseudomonadota bacterium]|nr:ABC transporter permease [Pseudomonadota bacterium]
VVFSLLVGVLYSAGALYGERRDRSILFWKSLPVSDLTAVLAKAAVPLVVLPLIVFAVAVAATSLMIILQTLVWLADGFDPRELWARVDLPSLWLFLLYGLPFMALWYAPIYAWLLLVSGWAERWPVLWAAAPFVAVLIVEHLLLHQTPAHWLLERRLGGGVLQPYTVDGAGAVWIERLSELEPARLYSLPGLWIGLIIAAALLAAAVRLRRSRGPI